MSEDIKIKEIRQTIRDWVTSINCPQEYQTFFKDWMLLNLYYNALSDKESEQIEYYS